MESPLEYVNQYSPAVRWDALWLNLGVKLEIDHSRFRYWWFSPYRPEKYLCWQARNSLLLPLKCHLPEWHCWVARSFEAPCCLCLGRGWDVVRRDSTPRVGPVGGLFSERLHVCLGIYLRGLLSVSLIRPRGPWGRGCQRKEERSYFFEYSV